MLVLEIAILWILVIPAVVVIGLSIAQRVLAAGVTRRRQASPLVWAAGHERDDRVAHAFERRPGHGLPRRPRTLSRR
jgi:hypothetical protein